MDVRHFTHFLAVVESKSVGRAAELLKITQPALSKSIRRLEDTLQVQLFDRGPEGMAPTIYAEALAERARFIAIEMKHAIEEIGALRGAMSGAVSVGSVPSLMGPLLGPVTARLAAKRPELRINVVEGFLDTLLQQLRKGELDLVLGTWTESGVPDEFEGEFLFRDGIVVAARKGHPLLAGGRVSLKMLRRFPWVMALEPDPMRGRMRAIFVRHRMEPPEPRVTTNSASYIKAVLAASDFVSLMPRHLLATEEAAGLLAALPLTVATPRREVGILRRKRSSIGPAARAMIAELREAMRRRGNGRS
jgi:LysR family transcriptional regulator of gallate degradation